MAGASTTKNKPAPSPFPIPLALPSQTEDGVGWERHSPSPLLLQPYKQLTLAPWCPHANHYTTQ